MNIAIVGLGLIGGSLAQAISRRTGHRVYAADRNPAVLRQALAEGAAHAPLTDAALAHCDVALLALYPTAAVEYATAHAAAFSSDCVVVDCCGVKGSVCAPLEALAAAHGFCFVGGHPMAGTERSGYTAARADLFDNASMILTPPPGTPDGAMRRLTSLLGEIGFARIQLCTPTQHDAIIAFTSQLAHVVSCAYVEGEHALDAAGYAAGSFADMTRVARLNEEMWTQLFLANAEQLAAQTHSLAQRLLEYAATIRQGDAASLHHRLQQARLRKEACDTAQARSGETS